MAFKTFTNFSQLLTGAMILLAPMAKLGAQSVPLTDPYISPSEYAPFDDTLRGQHPRLLFNNVELAQLSADVLSEPLLPHYNKLVGYLDDCVAPDNTDFRTDPVEAQRQGFWRMPTVAMHYALTGDTTSRDRTLAFMEWINDLEDWETTDEGEGGESAANMLVGGAIAYDILYDYLTENDRSFRNEFRNKLFTQAREMYYLGHLGRNQWGYTNLSWIDDPSNSHRWRRLAGLTLAMLVAYEGSSDEEWMLRQVYDELAFIAEYLPPDGSHHESPLFQVLGGAYLTLAMQASENCFGTDYLDLPFYQNIARFHVHSIAPGFKNYFMFNDMEEKPGFLGQFYMYAAARHGQDDLLAAMDHHFSVEPSAYEFGWLGVLWRGTHQPNGSIENLPLVEHFSDIGVTYMREGWDAGDAAAMFISNAPGGQRLNDYRNATYNQYINVGHDDPSANSFILYKDGEWVAETDRISYAKYSKNHNTILIDGKGQQTAGRAEGLKYWQPSQYNYDMAEYATSIQNVDNTDVVLAEAEASKYYQSPYYYYTFLNRFRRTFIWLPGKYVLILDDVRPTDITDNVSWLIQSEDIEFRNSDMHEYTLVKNDARCEFQVAATKSTILPSTRTSSADNRRSSLGWKQLIISKQANGDIQYASVFDLWDLGNLQVAISNVTSTGATLTVTGNGINDTWYWNFATSVFGASEKILAAAPSIVEEPKNVDTGIREPFSITVQRGGLSDQTYQWYFGSPGDTSMPVGTDSRTLHIGGVANPSQYWVRISNDYGFTDSAAALVGLTNGYDVWAQQHIPDEPRSDTGDFDKDGLSNLVEYALGLDPTKPSPSPSLTDVGGEYHLKFSIPETPLRDIRYDVEQSLLNGEWYETMWKIGDENWTTPYTSFTYQVGDPEDGLIPVTMKTYWSTRFYRLNITRF